LLGAAVEQEDVAVDPTTAEMDGLTFVVEDDEDDAGMKQRQQQQQVAAFFAVTVPVACPAKSIYVKYAVLQDACMLQEASFVPGTPYAAQPVLSCQCCFVLFAADIDPAELEFVEEISAEDARDIALALEDLVSGTVTSVDASGVMVSYTLEDGSSAEVGAARPWSDKQLAAYARLYGHTELASQNSCMS
jgi:hypothetical protein